MTFLETISTTNHTADATSHITINANCALHISFGITGCICTIRLNAVSVELRDELAPAQQTDCRITTLSWDETVTQITKTEDDCASVNAEGVLTQPFMMMHASVTSKHPNSAREVPLPPCFLSTTSADCQYRALTSRIPSWSAMELSTPYFYIICISTDAARKVPSTVDIIQSQISSIVPLVLVLHMVCLMHQLHLSICAYLIPMLLLSPILCGSLLRQKSHNNAKLRKAVKHAIYSTKRTHCQNTCIITLMHIERL